MTPALALGSVFPSVTTRATSSPSPTSGRYRYCMWSAVVHTSLPEPLTVYVPFANVELPGLLGIPRRADVLVLGQDHGGAGLQDVGIGRVPGGVGGPHPVEIGPRGQADVAEGAAGRREGRDGGLRWKSVARS